MAAYFDWGSWNFANFRWPDGQFKVLINVHLMGTFRNDTSCGLSKEYLNPLNALPIISHSFVELYGKLWYF